MRKLKLLILIILGTAVYFYFQFEPEKDFTWGINYSIPQAHYLGLDARKTYQEILRDLKPSVVRLPVYWETVEREKDKFDFSDYDFLLSESAKAGAKAILVLGYKQPRWPECHEPAWAKDLESGNRNQEILNYIRAAVERYKDHDAIAAWQVENEPFFPYGPNCGSVSQSQFSKELALVKSLDNRPIVVTDSGEKGAWIHVAWVGGDIFGSTMYREVHHHKKGYVKYSIPPALYRLKAGVVKALTRADKFVGIELQAEPWFDTDVYHTPWERQSELMNPQRFAENVDYARRVGFAQNYFWGVEWWYWAKKEGHPEMWEAAKRFFETDNQ